MNDFSVCTYLGARTELVFLVILQGRDDDACHSLSQHLALLFVVRPTM